MKFWTEIPLKQRDQSVNIHLHSQVKAVSSTSLSNLEITRTNQKKHSHGGDDQRAHLATTKKKKKKKKHYLSKTLQY